MCIRDRLTDGILLGMLYELSTILSALILVNNGTEEKIILIVADIYQGKKIKNLYSIMCYYTFY